MPYYNVCYTSIWHFLYILYGFSRASHKCKKIVYLSISGILLQFLKPHNIPCDLIELFSIVVP